MLRLAYDEWEVLSSVPRVRLEKEPQGRLRWLTPEQASVLLDACGKSRNPDLRDLVEFALFTGLRRGEALGLTWERVDRARGVILLNLTKSNRRREVPLNSRADTMLARRGPKDSGLVFGLVPGTTSGRPGSWRSNELHEPGLLLEAIQDSLHLHPVLDLLSKLGGWRFPSSQRSRTGCARRGARPR